jgi:hypothetical protein
VDKAQQFSVILLLDTDTIARLAIDEHKDRVFQGARTVDANHISYGKMFSGDYHRDITTFFNDAAKERVDIYLSALQKALEKPRILALISNEARNEAVTSIKKRLKAEIEPMEQACRNRILRASAKGAVISDDTFKRLSQIYEDGMQRAWDVLEIAHHESEERKRAKAGESWWRTQGVSLLAGAILTQMGNCVYQGYTKSEQRQFAERRELTGQVIPLLNSCLTLTNDMQTLILGRRPFTGAKTLAGDGVEATAAQMTTVGRQILALRVQSEAVFDSITAKNLRVIGNELAFMTPRLSQQPPEDLQQRKTAQVELLQDVAKVSDYCADFERELLKSTTK